MKGDRQKTTKWVCRLILIRVISGVDETKSAAVTKRQIFFFFLYVSVLG